MKKMERGSNDYCNYLYDAAYKAAYKGESFNRLLISEMDAIDACTIEELQFLITGWCIGEIERENEEDQIRLVTNKH